MRLPVPTVLAIAIGITVALYVLPGGRLVGRPLVLLSTFFHELGHGITAMLTGGRFERLHLFSNASGVAMYRGRPSRLARALVAAGGPLGPPVSAAALFWAASQVKTAHIALAALAASMVLVCLIWVRNAFGFVFVVLLGAALGAVAYFANDKEARIACAFLAIQMALSVFSRGDYLFTSHARTNDGMMPSDTSQIAQALFFPYWFWGALIGLVSIGILGAGMWAFSRAI